MTGQEQEKLGLETILISEASQSESSEDCGLNAHSFLSELARSNRPLK